MRTDNICVNLSLLRNRRSIFMADCAQSGMNTDFNISSP